MYENTEDLATRFYDASCFLPRQTGRTKNEERKMKGEWGTSEVLLEILLQHPQTWEEAATSGVEERHYGGRMTRNAKPTKHEPRSFKKRTTLRRPSQRGATRVGLWCVRLCTVQDSLRRANLYRRKRRGNVTRALYLIYIYRHWSPAFGACGKRSGARRLSASSECLFQKN